MGWPVPFRPARLHYPCNSGILETLSTRQWHQRKEEPENKYEERKERWGDNPIAFNGLDNAIGAVPPCRRQGKVIRLSLCRKVGAFQFAVHKPTLRNDT